MQRECGGTGSNGQDLCWHRGGLLDAHLNSTARVGASTMMPYGLDEKFSSENAVSNTQAKSLHGLVWTKETEKPQNLLLSVCLVAVSDS